MLLVCYLKKKSMNFFLDLNLLRNKEYFDKNKTQFTFTLHFPSH